jgi:peptide/nickel transport system substrate-binding protein
MVYWPRHLLQDLEPGQFYDWDFWKQPVGNGPFRYRRHVPGTMVEVEANPEFYAGLPTIRSVTFQFGTQGAVAELLSGNVDVLTWVNRVDLPALERDGRFAIHHQIHPDIPFLSTLFWNHRNPLFSDPSVRRALTHGIDRESLKALLNLPESLRVVDGLFTPRQYRTDALAPPLAYDPTLSGRLLADAGWIDGDGDGIREREGRPFSFEAVVESGSEMEAVAVMVQANLRQVGVELNIQPLDRRLVQRRTAESDFEAVFSSLYNAPSGHRGWLGPDSNIGYSNAEVTSLLAAVGGTLDPDEIDVLYEQLTGIFMEEMPFTLFYPDVQTYAVHRRVRGLQDPHGADPVQFMERLSIDGSL